MRNISYGSSTKCCIICYPLAASYSSDSLQIHLSVSSAKMLKKLYYTCFGIAPKSRTTGLMYRDGFIPASHIVLIYKKKKKSKELVILGSKANAVTDRILDLCILIAKYNIFIAKLHGAIPHLDVFTRFLKNRAVLEKYY